MENSYDWSWEAKWNAGETEMDTILEKDVTYEIHLDLDWSDPKMAKDISIIAQGKDGGAIELKHWKGLKSATFPRIER